MNCVKCPIVEECEVSKMSTRSLYVGGLSYTTEMVPNTMSECPLLQIEEIVKALRDKGEKEDIAIP